MTIDPTLLAAVITITATILITVFSFGTKRLFVQIDNLCKSINELNTTMATMKTWVLTDFVSKADHEKAIVAMKEHVDTAIELHLAECERE